MTNQTNETLPTGTDAKRSPKFGKPRDPRWTAEERGIVAQGMRLGWTTREIKRRLPHRTMNAIDNKRTIIRNTDLPLAAPNGSAGGPRVVPAHLPESFPPETAPEAPVPGQPPATLSGRALNAKTYVFKHTERCQYPLNASWPFKYCGKKRAHRLSPYCATCMQRAYSIQPLYMRDAA